MAKFAKHDQFFKELLDRKIDTMEQLEQWLKDQSELEAANMNVSPSVRVKVPRLALAQASLECKLFNSLQLGANTLFIGEVVMFHVADHLLGPRMHINNFAPIGRLGSPSVYCRTIDRFDVPRITYAQWQKESK